MVNLAVATAALVTDYLLLSPPVAAGSALRLLGASLIVAAVAPARRGASPPPVNEAPISGRSHSSRTLLSVLAGVLGLLLLYGALRSALLSSATTTVGPGLAIAPIVEEMIYRGVIQRNLRVPLGSSGATCVASFAFWVGHWVGRGQVTGLHHLAAGWFLGWSYEKTGRLSVPVVLHCAGNLVWATAATGGAGL